ncbi:hypothetical protein GOODEAATRI_018622 [Goodea atripinnis]|uniref:LYST n=1 Tax=Goodea atripinnis TaxID=208336 RepID=A0ABV0NBN1_9TELE
MDNISPFRKRCIIPVLGLIENSLYENSLVHSILCMLLQLVNACPKLADILLDHGLLYVLFNTLSTLNGMENGSSGSQYFRIIEDLITLLGFMQTSKMRRTQEMAVALQFRVLQSAIEFIKTTANQEPAKLSGAVNTPTSPHHAIYQKRSVAMKDSIIPRIPRQHYCSYGQIPMFSPFSFLSQDSPLPSPTGTPSYMLHCDADVSEDLFDLLNIPDSPDHHIFTPDPGDQAHDESGSSSVPHSPTPFILPHASKKSFQKDILKLMMDGIKISLVGPVFFFLSQIFSCCTVHLLAKCLCRVATGQHGSWRSPKSSVAEDTVVLQGYFQGADRPSSGAHTQLITSTA